MTAPAPIEQVRSLPAGYAPRLVVLDYDGTLSLIRVGWPPVMARLMAEALAGTGASYDDMLALGYERIGRTAGQPTLQQMEWLAGEVQLRGGRPQPAEAYKHLYLERLAGITRGRINGLQSGSIRPDTLLVPGAVELLEALHAHGLLMAIASGTDREYLQQEAHLLGIRNFFGDAIYGPDPALPNYTKPWIIQNLLAHYSLVGSALLGFGDGPAEIEAVVAAGGVAVGLITNEFTGKGSDAEKRLRLIEAGAHIIIPDYTALDALLNLVLP